MGLKKKYIIANIVQGMNPPLLITRAVVEINKILEEKNREPLKIVLPLKRHDRRLEVILSRFQGEIDPSLILLNEFGAERLFNTMYTTGNYQSDLKRLPSIHPKIQEELLNHFKKEFEVSTLQGDKKQLTPEEGIELCRNQTTTLGFDVVYSLIFGQRSQILQAILNDPTIIHHYNRGELKTAKDIFAKIEDRGGIKFVQYPGIPLGRASSKDEIKTAFHFPFAPIQDTREMAPGIYVRLTGKPELDLTTRKAMEREIGTYCKEKGLTIYTPKDDQPRFAEQNIETRVASPNIISNPNIIANISNLGWGGILSSMLSHTALISPPFLYGMDDPERLYNGKFLESIGCVTYFDPSKRTPFTHIMEKSQDQIQNGEKFIKDIKESYNGLNGIQQVARTIAQIL